MIGGTKGSLSLPDLTFWTHEGQQSWWSPMTREHIGTDAVDPVEAQLRHFLDVIDGRAAPLVNARDGLRNIEVLEALKAAAHTSDAVPIRPGGQTLETP